MAARKQGEPVGQTDDSTAPAPDTDDRHWTERVRARARELGLTDADVARRLDLSPTRYANYMGRSREPDLMLFTRICRTLDTTPDRILSFGTGPMPDSPEGMVLSRAVSTLRALPRGSLPLAHALLTALAADAGRQPAKRSASDDAVRPPENKSLARKPGGRPRE